MKSVVPRLLSTTVDTASVWIITTTCNAPMLNFFTLNKYRSHFLVPSRRHVLGLTIPIFHLLNEVKTSRCINIPDQMKMKPTACFFPVLPCSIDSAIVTPLRCSKRKFSALSLITFCRCFRVVVKSFYRHNSTFCVETKCDAVFFIFPLILFRLKSIIVTNVRWPSSINCHYLNIQFAGIPRLWM